MDMDWQPKNHFIIIKGHMLRCTWDFVIVPLLVATYILYIVATNRDSVTSDNAVSVLTLNGPLPSSELQKELVLNYRMHRDAAIKLIERSNKEGKIKRFMRLKSGGYIYYIEKIHSIECVRNAARQYIPCYRPRLSRLITVIDKARLISVYELCRLTNLKYFEKGALNNKLLKILQDLNLFGIITKENYLISPSVDYSKVDDLIRQARIKFQNEANLLYAIRNKFLKNRLAKEFTLNRSPNEQSLLVKFDATGNCGFRKKAEMVLEVYSRRAVLIEDLIGYQERIWSSIMRKALSKPVFCFVLATSFEESALNFALEKKMRPIIIDPNFNLKPILKPTKNATKTVGWHGRLADAQGLAFESVVERVFRAEGFDTEIRKRIYLSGNELTETKTKRCFTDVDVFAAKGDTEMLLVECKSAKRQIPRKPLLQKVRALKRISEYFLTISHNKLQISVIFIGKCNTVDKIEAQRVMASIPVSFLTPSEFHDQHKEQLKGEPDWLFSAS